MRNPKSLRIWLARIALTLFAVIILLPMVQTFLYSFSSIPEMQGLMDTRGKRTEETWMDLHLSPHKISLGQYEQVLLSKNLSRAGYAVEIPAAKLNLETLQTAMETQVRLPKPPLQNLLTPLVQEALK